MTNTTDWFGVFCAGCTFVCIALTCINVKFYMEYVKDKLQDKRRESQEK